MKLLAFGGNKTSPDLARLLETEAQPRLPESRPALRSECEMFPKWASKDHKGSNWLLLPKHLLKKHNEMLVCSHHHLAAVNCRLVAQHGALQVISAVEWRSSGATIQSLFTNILCLLVKKMMPREGPARPQPPQPPHGPISNMNLASPAWRIGFTAGSCVVSSVIHGNNAHGDLPKEEKESARCSKEAR